MPSVDYLEMILQKAKEYLPDWLFQEIHKVARGSAGGKAKARNIIEISKEDRASVDELSSEFWLKNWYKMYPKDGEGKFSYQHHWRGLDEEKSKMGENELLNTNNSIHGDLRFTNSSDLWGFSVFLGTTQANKPNDKLMDLKANEKLRGDFKVAEPMEWLDIARGKPYVAEPSKAGATANTYGKIFEEDYGTYKVGVWREHSFEIFLNGKDLKGRYIIQFVPVDGGRVWMLSKPEDQTPYSETNKFENVVQELKDKNQKYLIWGSPSEKARLINVNDVVIQKEYISQIIKTDNEKKMVTGIVLEPDTVDSQGDTITAEEIEKSAHFFMQKSRTIGLRHKGVAPAELVESYVAPTDMEMGNQKVKKGSWVITVKILDDKLWEDVKNGTFTGFSVGGFGIREPY